MRITSLILPSTPKSHQIIFWGNMPWHIIYEDLRKEYMVITRNSVHVVKVKNPYSHVRPQIPLSTSVNERERERSGGWGGGGMNALLASGLLVRWLFQAAYVVWRVVRISRSLRPEPGVLNELFIPGFVHFDWIAVKYKFLGKEGRTARVKVNSETWMIGSYGSTT